MDYKAIGRKITIARKDAQLTQSELPDLIGTSQSNLNHIEKGVVRLTLDTLESLSTALHRPISYFLGINSDLTEDEEQVLQIYRSYPSGGPVRPFALNALRSLLQTIEAIEADRHQLDQTL